MIIFIQKRDRSYKKKLYNKKNWTPPPKSAGMGHKGVRTGGYKCCGARCKKKDYRYIWKYILVQKCSIHLFEINFTWNIFVRNNTKFTTLYELSFSMAITRLTFWFVFFFKFQGILNDLQVKISCWLFQTVVPSWEIYCSFTVMNAIRSRTLIQVQQVMEDTGIISSNFLEIFQLIFKTYALRLFKSYKPTQF